MEIRRMQGTARERADREGAMAQVEANEANIAYVAMMADVELAEDEEVGADEAHE